MDSIYESVTGYKKVAGYEDLNRCYLKALKSVKTQQYKQIQKRTYYSGGWIRTIGLRVMSPSGSPGYPTPLSGFIYQATLPEITIPTYEQ